MTIDKQQFIGGKGLFGTDVHWEDIEWDMRKAFSTNAQFGPKKSILNIGDGNGFLSKIGLVVPDWQDAKDNEVLPNKFVVKISSPINVVNLFDKLEEKDGNTLGFSTEERIQELKDQVMKLHNIEVTAYNLLHSYKADGIPKLKIYYARRFTEKNRSKGYLLMNFVENLASIHIWNNLKVDEVRQGIRAIAALQAVSLQMHEDELSLFPKRPLQSVFGTFFTTESLSAFGSNFGDVRTERMRKLAEEVKEKVCEIADLQFYDNIPQQMNMRSVLCHGDMWSTNCLWNISGDEVKLAAVIDWQTTCYSNAASDLARFFCSTMSGSDRRKYTFSLLEEFYTIFEELVKQSGLETPYTLEQLKEAYRRFIPFGCFMVIPMTGGMAETLIENKSEEEKEKIRPILEEKLSHLVEDMLEFHQRNMNLRA